MQPGRKVYTGDCWESGSWAQNTVCRWGQVIALYRERTRSHSWLLTSHWLLWTLGEKCFFSLSPIAYKNGSRIPHVIGPSFSKTIYLGHPAFYFLLFKGTKTLFARRASDSIKLRKDVLRPRSALACTHLWSSLWMEFCAYSSPNLAFKGYVVHSSVCLRSPFRTLSLALTVERSLCPQ